MNPIKALAVALGLLWAAPTLADAPDRAATEAIIHDYLLAHPEIIPAALQALEERQQAQAISANRKAIETPYGNEVEGNPKADVTLVEFFDYNCGYCRASVADISHLLAEDKNLRVVYREIPVLGAESDAAAMTSLSVAQCHNEWAAFHRAIFAGGDAGQPALAKIMRKLNIGMCEARTNQHWRDEINQNLGLAQSLKITGTPSRVVGDKLLSGAVGYDALKSAIAEVRSKRPH
jgi:protein-disulfide isomerase